MRIEWEFYRDENGKTWKKPVLAPNLIQEDGSVWFPLFGASSEEKED